MYIYPNDPQPSLDFNLNLPAMVRSINAVGD